MKRTEYVAIRLVLSEVLDRIYFFEISKYSRAPAESCERGSGFGFRFRANDWKHVIADLIICGV